MPLGGGDTIMGRPRKQTGLIAATAAAEHADAARSITATGPAKWVGFNDEPVFGDAAQVQAEGYYLPADKRGIDIGPVPDIGIANPFEISAAELDAAAKNVIVMPTAAPTMYRWLIEGTGSVFTPTLDVPNVATVEEARAVALTHDLTTLERNFIETTAPLVVRDTSEVTLEHDAALAENARLRAENEGYVAARESLDAVLVAADMPGLSADERLTDGQRRLLTTYTDDTEAQIVAIRDAFERRERELADGLLIARRSLDALADATGFAPPAPPPDVRDFTGWLVVPPDGVSAECPLPGAALSNAVPGTPWSERELIGLRQVHRLADDLRIRSGSISESDEARAVMERVAAEAGIAL